MIATRATFVEFQQVKTRGVYKLVFEVDEAQADQALQALGGLPQGKESRWCGIVLLDVRGSNQPDKAVNSGDAAARVPKQSDPQSGQQTLHGGGGTDHKPRRHIHEMPRSQQAAMLCKDERFQKWIGRSGDEELAADLVRRECAVQSRADLDTHPGPAQAWDRLHAKYLADTGLTAEVR